MRGHVIAEVSIVPIGTPACSLGQYVGSCLRIVEDTPNIRYELTAMGTIIEGSLERVLELVQRMHEVPFGMGVQRVVTTIKIDDRRDKLATIEDKVESVLKSSSAF